MLKNKKAFAVLIAGFAIIIATAIIIQQGEKTMPPVSNKTAENDYVIFEKRETSDQLADPTNSLPLYLNTYLYNSGKLIKEGNLYEKWEVAHYGFSLENLETQIDEERMGKIRAIVKGLIASKDCFGGNLEPSGSLNYILRFDGQEKRLTGLTPCDEELGKIKELLGGYIGGYKDPSDPAIFSLAAGKSYIFETAKITLVSFGIREEVLPLEADAKIKVEYENKTWNFDMGPSDTKEFGDIAIQYIKFNAPSTDPFKGEVIFAIFTKAKTYQNKRFGFEFSVPKNATVSELNDGAYANKIILGSKGIATIKVYKAASVDEWLSTHVSFAIDEKGNKLPAYERKTINGNSVAILYDRSLQAHCIKQAIIHYDQVAAVIDWLATPNSQNQYVYDAAYCPVIEELVNSFEFVK